MKMEKLRWKSELLNSTLVEANFAAQIQNNKI